MRYRLDQRIVPSTGVSERSPKFHSHSLCSVLRDRQLFQYSCIVMLHESQCPEVPCSNLEFCPWRPVSTAVLGHILLGSTLRKPGTLSISKAFSSSPDVPSCWRSTLGLTRSLGLLSWRLLCRSAINRQDPTYSSLSIRMLRFVLCLRPLHCSLDALLSDFRLVKRHALLLEIICEGDREIICCSGRARHDGSMAISASDHAFILVLSLVRILPFSTWPSKQVSNDASYSVRRP